VNLRSAVAEIEQIAAALRGTSYCPHKPHPRQAEFVRLDCIEALYGGAAGGGKSDALLMAALQHVRVPGYAALILRRKHVDLIREDAIMARAAKWLETTDAVWSAERKTWTFPSGATLSFGHLDHVHDLRNYQGGAWQFIGVDELTQMPEAWYRYLFSRLRRTTQQVPLRMRGATNPGDIGHDWVHQRFVAPGARAAFVPARIEDNPSLDAQAYFAALSELDEIQLAQLRDGVWVRDSAGKVYRYNADNVIDSAPIVDYKVLALDFGVVDDTSFSILGWRKNERTVHVLRSWKLKGLSPGEAASMVRDLERDNKFHAIVGDVGGLGKAFQAEARSRFGLPIEAADKNNKRGYQRLLNGALKSSELRVVRADCTQLLSEWDSVVWDESQKNEIGENHCADGVLYGWRRCVAYLESAAKPADTEEQRLIGQLIKERSWRR
jgi:hypothetical protein